MNFAIYSDTALRKRHIHRRDDREDEKSEDVGIILVYIQAKHNERDIYTGTMQSRWISAYTQTRPSEGDIYTDEMEERSILRPGRHDEM